MRALFDFHFFLISIFPIFTTCGGTFLQKISTFNQTIEGPAKHFFWRSFCP
jgi:hypothetical protein